MHVRGAWDALSPGSALPRRSVHVEVSQAIDDDSSNEDEVNVEDLGDVDDDVCEDEAHGEEVSTIDDEAGEGLGASDPIRCRRQDADRRRQDAAKPKSRCVFSHHGFVNRLSAPPRTTKTLSLWLVGRGHPRNAAGSRSSAPHRPHQGEPAGSASQQPCGEAAVHL
ncbi:hypothetical protein TRIUR3_00639 [Triticum urartu]|uniref:Uncharacterized protein n=1 Tax=Triticum urartu TaxID=4572 RepID=M8B0R5_TRIUA|nr:hypothetical protein TRIUR3_00639 [Triticum urartu]